MKHTIWKTLAVLLAAVCGWQWVRREWRREARTIGDALTQLDGRITLQGEEIAALRAALEDAEQNGRRLETPVCVTSGGKKYHKPGCNCLTGQYRILDREAAKQEGYTPCTRCRPET